MDPSVFAACGADDQVTIWDLAVEAEDLQVQQGRTIPPQLLFIHQGQQHVKVSRVTTRKKKRGRREGGGGGEEQEACSTAYQKISH